ncbi:MAG: hypothetical protein IKP88_13825 [Lachnospiraceae bacterium]|nr:hypothetical protein [Lachnospiraceae bacterium]
MTNSYCGKNCGFCTSYTEGKCIGCQPQIYVPLHNSIYISGADNAEKMLTIDGHREESGTEQETDIIEETPANNDRNEIRFSEFCQIAFCCKNKKIEGCHECLKTFACQKYSQKGIMNTIIESKMEAWGMVDHGLKEAVPFLMILLFCNIIGAISGIPLNGFGVSASAVTGLFFLMSVLISGVQTYAYFRLRNFNSEFFAVTVLSAVYILSKLFLKLLDVIDYGIIGVILSMAAVAVQIVSSMLCYKISFDAYAELISPVDPTLETRWLKVWKITLIFYILAFIVALFQIGSLGISGFILCFAVASAILNIITFILMISTIKVCRSD